MYVHMCLCDCVSGCVWATATFFFRLLLLCLLLLLFLLSHHVLLFAFCSLCFIHTMLHCHASTVSAHTLFFALHISPSDSFYFYFLCSCGLRRVGNCNWNLALKRVNDLLFSHSLTLPLSHSPPLACIFLYSCCFSAKLFWRLFCRFASCLLVWVMVVLPRHGYPNTHTHTHAQACSLSYLRMCDWLLLFRMCSPLTPPWRLAYGTALSLDSGFGFGFAPCYDCSFVVRKLNNIVAAAFHAIKS